MEYPLNDALPDTSNPRDRLLAKLFKYRKSVGGSQAKDNEDEDDNGGSDGDGDGERGEGKVVAKDEDYELLYAYTLVTGQIAAEIKKIEKEIEVLFGVVDEDLFELE